VRKLGEIGRLNKVSSRDTKESKARRGGVEDGGRATFDVTEVEMSESRRKVESPTVVEFRKSSTSQFFEVREGSVRLKYGMLFDALNPEADPFRWLREDVVPKRIESVMAKGKLIDVR